MQTRPVQQIDFRKRLLALLIALSLAVSWYFAVKPWAMGIPGNGTNFWAFSAMSHAELLQQDGTMRPLYHLDTLGDWRHRVGGMLITGKLVDSCVVNGQAQIPDIQNVFGIYHATWLFLLFVVLIIFLEDPFLIICGTFGGLLYTLTPAASNYAYPWDMPATVFFVLSYLLWQRKQYYWMLAVILVGYPFKETVALTAVLYFFTDLPKWRRVQLFVLVAVVSVIFKILILGFCTGHFTIFTHNYQAGEKGLLAGGRWLNNVKEIFSLKWNHFIFVNGGTFIASLFLPMRTRMQIGTKVLLALFFCGQFYVGALNEFRVMLEVLPVSLLYLSDFLHPSIMSANPEPATPPSTAPRLPAKKARV